MALPPIINNLPIFKALKAEGSDQTEKADKVSVPAGGEDIVEISAEAQERLEGVRTLSEQ